MEKGETFHNFNFGNPIFDHQQGSFFHSSSGKYLQNIWKKGKYYHDFNFGNPIFDHQQGSFLHSSSSKYLQNVWEKVIFYDFVSIL